MGRATIACHVGHWMAWVVSAVMTLTAVVSMVGLQSKRAGRRRWGVLPSVVKNGDEGQHQRSEA